MLLLYFYSPHVLLCLVRCILDGLSGGKKVQAKQPCVPREAVVKWYTARKHKVCKYELSHESIAAFRARSWLRWLTH